MTLPEQILADLLIGRSTVSNIAIHLGERQEVVVAALYAERAQGTVEAKALQNLTVWQLTEQGRQLASLLPAVPKFPHTDDLA